MVVLAVQAYADTRLSVRQTLGTFKFKEISKATEQKWIPSDVDTKIKSYSGYTRNPKWNNYRPYKDILNALSTDYMIEEFQIDLPKGKKAPYFIVRHNDTKLDGTKPALQVGLPSMADYPIGAAINILPQKLWLDHGGIVVLSPINIEEPIILVSGTASDKQNYYKQFADHFGSIGKHLLKTKKARVVHFESQGDTFFIGLYVYLKYAEVYSRVVVSNPEMVNAVASTVTLPTPKTWPDVLLQDWYRDLLAQEFKPTKKYPSVLIVTDTQQTFVSKMAYGFSRQYGFPVEYMEIPLWSHSDVDAKTTKFFITKYNFLNAGIEASTSSEASK